MNFLGELYHISELIPSDYFGGETAFSKIYLMAYLISKNNLKTFVEIGVYRGRILFPITHAIKQNNGIAYGVDPYNKDAAREFDVQKDTQKQLNKFLDTLDFEQVYDDVINMKSELDFEDHLIILRQKSSESVEFFNKNNIKIDMIHIDGNHDTKCVMKDVKLYLPLLKSNSIIVMDDIDWDSVKPAYEKLKETTTLIFETTNFAILINNKISEETVKQYQFEFKNTFNIIELFIEQKSLSIHDKNSINHLEMKLLEKSKDVSNLKNKLSDKDNYMLELESKIRTLANSRKSDIIKNFQILFPEYKAKSSRKSFPAYLSNMPYLYIIFKTKGNIKKLRDYIRSYRTIKRLNLFDEDYYLNRYRNVLTSGMEPLIHYLFFGWKEGKNPSPEFDGDNYLNRYPDVKNSHMNPLIHYSLYGIDEKRKPKTKISVIILSYNHEKFIKKCLDSILIQKGDFELEIILGDDKSQDNTRKILENYQKNHPKIIKQLPLNENMGVTKNLERCLKAVTGDYVAICEGDDYWTDPYKLKKQANFLDEKQHCSMCFNSILINFMDDTEKNYISPNLSEESYTTHDLILENFIGNFSCCMYRSDVVKNLPKELFDLFTVDWFFNISCSEYGYIGFLNEQMSVYNIHSGGLWSGKSSDEKIADMDKYIDSYNEFLSYKYDTEFKQFKEKFSNAHKRN
jgi:glycosyltransferase involved in cell wall biosynthesis